MCLPCTSPITPTEIHDKLCTAYAKQLVTNNNTKCSSTYTADQCKSYKHTFGRRIFNVHSYVCVCFFCASCCLSYIDCLMHSYAASLCVHVSNVRAGNWWTAQHTTYSHQCIQIASIALQWYELCKVCKYVVYRERECWLSIRICNTTQRRDRNTYKFMDAETTVVRCNNVVQCTCFLSLSLKSLSVGLVVAQ